MLDTNNVLERDCERVFAEDRAASANTRAHDHLPVRIWPLHFGTGGDDVLTMLCLDAAVEVVIGARAARLRLVPGQLACVSKAQAADLDCSGHGSLCLVQCPRSAIQARGGKLPVIPLGPVETRHGLGALVRQLIVDLCHAQANEEASMMQETFFQLLASLLDAHVAPRRVKPALPARIVALIDGQLADPDLSPEMIACACGLSLRSLQRRFAKAGESVGHWIRRRRLERCYADLCNPRWRKHSIASIAFRWGFVEQAHFSRCFRQQYGVSPREVRPPASM